MYRDHPRHHRTPQTRHALLRKTWLPPLGKDFRLFRHAFVRIPETIATRRHSRLLTGALLRPSTCPKLSRSARAPRIFLLFSFPPPTRSRNSKIPLQYPRTSLRHRGHPTMNLATTIRKSIVVIFVLALLLLPKLPPARIGTASARYWVAAKHRS